MSGEIIAALIGLAGSQVALWLRFEHRMTVLETMLKLREEKAKEPDRVKCPLFLKRSKECVAPE
jgi:hypothetical protein